MLSKNQKESFLNMMYGNWEAVDSKGEKYRLSITSDWFSLKKIETEMENFRYLGDFGMGCEYRIRGGETTYGILVLSSAKLVLGKHIGNSAILQFEEFGRFQKADKQ